LVEAQAGSPRAPRTRRDANMPLRKYLLSAAYLCLLLLSLALLGYGWMMRQLDIGQNAFRQGDNAQALAAYRRAERPFQQLPWLAYLFKQEYVGVNLNQVAILYGQKQDQPAMEKLEQLPAHWPEVVDSGDYAFWMGNLLFRRAVESKDPEAALTALKASLAEFQKGLAAQPEDWDLKFDYELIRAIFAKQDRGQNQQPEKLKSIIDKMRPQAPTPQPIAPEKRG